MMDQCVCQELELGSQKLLPISYCSFELIGLNEAYAVVCFIDVHRITKT